MCKLNADCFSHLLTEANKGISHSIKRWIKATIILLIVLAIKIYLFLRQHFSEIMIAVIVSLINVFIDFLF